MVQIHLLLAVRGCSLGISYYSTSRNILQQLYIHFQEMSLSNLFKPAQLTRKNLKDLLKTEGTRLCLAISCLYLAYLLSHILHLISHPHINVMDYKAGPRTQHQTLSLVYLLATCCHVRFCACAFHKVTTHDNRLRGRLS